MIKVATNYIKSFNFLDRSNHLEAIIQKYEWRATFYLESGLLQLHRAIKCNTSEPKGRGRGEGVPPALCSELQTAVRMRRACRVEELCDCFIFSPCALCGTPRVIRGVLVICDRYTERAAMLWCLRRIYLSLCLQVSITAGWCTLSATVLLAFA